MNDHAVRSPAVAGRFYPADPDQLEAEVQRYLNAARAPEDCLDPPLVKAVIVPHAGYPYSGPIAASAYVQLACSDVPVRRFILLGPAHFAPVDGLALSGATAFDTPLGRVPVDAAARDALASFPAVVIDDYAHRPEHCLEVELPFLQTLFPDFSIVPLLVGEATAEQVAEVLEVLWGGPETRIVISSDLSHYHDHATARRLDEETAAAIVALRPEELREDCACGRAAIAGLLLAARRRAMHAELVDLRSSGDTGGPLDRVVGYGAFLFTAPAPAAY
ncbi:MEMO1 family protein Thimo_3050 [Candidatus Promineifilum breve]|uniref:MEMO1 family protein CFX0092_A1440 n=1 Tax=Candidatus Promineifilum breve TaxID=1806508 RepID=A0A160T311_9CHLR|nr:AmmeMemoRadiSam system protein B [Candidatus Promineifilum breve]CUS03318.2 MEMO1 family protein Thimo_3050 [Candidatus Promineifilum breve]